MTADELKRKREKLGLSQIDMAAKLGVDQTAVSKWEKGKREIPKTVVLLLDCLQREARRKE